MKQDIDEKKFAEVMTRADRLMTWQEFRRALETGKRTAIGEFLSTKGPFRLWWTAEDIPTTSPHAWKREQHVGWMEPEVFAFSEWCYQRFTNPESGLAGLVPVSKDQRKQFN